MIFKLFFSLKKTHVLLFLLYKITKLSLYLIIFGTLFYKMQGLFCHFANTRTKNGVILERKECHACMASPWLRDEHWILFHPKNHNRNNRSMKRKRKTFLEFKVTCRECELWSVPDQAFRVS